jgi:hypothetical protein
MLDAVVDLDDLPAQGPITRKQSIQDLFDFSSNHWVAAAQQSAIGSLEDEMKFYDLLDLDAAGDLNHDLDDVIESVFLKV